MPFIIVMEVTHGLRDQQPDLKLFPVVLSLFIFLLSWLILFLTESGFTILGCTQRTRSQQPGQGHQSSCKLLGERQAASCQSCPAQQWLTAQVN